MEGKRGRILLGDGCARRRREERGGVRVRKGGARYRGGENEGKPRVMQRGS